MGKSGKGETIHNRAELLDAMGRCRRALIQAQTGVKPMGVMYSGCSMVTAAIDALAFLITGQPHYYSICGSAPTPGVRSWQDERG